MTKQFKIALVKGIDEKLKVDTKYYVDSYHVNIFPEEMDVRFKDMFSRGSGNELLPKNGKKENAAALYSSSMLAFNFFHWINEKHPFKYEGVTYDKVVFEEQFRCLANRNNKANIDIVLISDDNRTLLLLESKFTEHFSNNSSYMKKIGPSYTNPKSYFCSGNSWAEIVGIYRKLASDSKKGYFDGIKQDICHLISLNSLIENQAARNWFNKESWIKKIYGIELKGNETFIFKNIVFSPKNNFKKEAAYTKTYKGLYSDFEVEVQGRGFLPTNLTFSMTTYGEMWKEFMSKLIWNESLKKYLQRRYLDLTV